MASRDDSVHSGRHDDEVKVLTTQVSFLEEEVAALRSRLADSPHDAPPSLSHAGLRARG